MRVDTTPHALAPPPSDGPAMVRVRLLGELVVERDGVPVGPIESVRVKSLLGYLVLHRDAPTSRQRLAFLLWPDSTEAQARTNLRKALHTLRRDAPELEPCLTITPHSLQWTPRGDTWVDVDALHTAVASAAAAGTGAADVVEALERAASLYGSDLLDGCDDEWIVTARERVRDTYMSALNQLSAARSARGEHAEAVRVAREVVRREPLQEAGYRLLMAAHAAGGDRAAAVHTYHQCASTLQRELGVGPADETVEVYARLTATEHRDRAGASMPALPSGTPLVGRADEWAALTSHWHAAEARGSRLVIVSGEAGVGKTRLVEELADWCAHRGAVVASARSYAAEGELGLGAVIAWLRANAMRDRLAGVSRADAAELARLLPELFEEQATPVVGDETDRRRRLFDAVARVVLADERPTLLVLDDAQWTDAETLNALHYLLRSSARGALLVVATVRREDVGATHPLAELVGALTMTDRVSELVVHRFGTVETGRLARELLGHELEAQHVDALHADTEGIPLFVVEAIRSGWTADDRRRAVTPRLQAVIGGRVRHVAAEGRELLSVAAVVGREFDVALLRDVSALGDAAFAAALDELWRRGLVREHGADDYDFSHGRIRDVVYEMLDPATRRHHHRSVAAALERLHADALDQVSGRIAAHYDAAGHMHQAIDWYDRAATEALRRYASTEALRLLERAYELVLASGAEGRPERELGVLSAMATPLATVEGFSSDRLGEVQRRVSMVAARVGRDVEPRVLRSIVMSRLCNDEFAEAVVAAEQLRDAATRAGDDGMRTESEYLMGIGCFWGSDFGSAREHFERAVDEFRQDDRGEHVMRFGHDPALVCLSRLGNTLRFLGDVAGARRARDDAVAMAIDLGHPYTRGVVLVFAAMLALDLGERDRFGELASALAAEEQFARPNAIKSGAVTGCAEVLAGRTADGLARIHRAIDVCGPTNPAPGFRAALMRLLVGAHHVAGDAAGGLDAVDDALRAGGTRIWEPDLRVLRADFLASLGRPLVEVEAELDRAIAVAVAHGAAGQVALVDERRARSPQPR